MLNVNFKLQSKTENQFKIVLSQYKDEESFAQNIIGHQITELKTGIVNIQVDLKQFEQNYGYLTEEFYQKFENGELEDSEEFITWSGIYEMLLLNRKRLEELDV